MRELLFGAIFVTLALLEHTQAGPGFSSSSLGVQLVVLMVLVVFVMAGSSFSYRGRLWADYVKSGAFVLVGSALLLLSSLDGNTPDLVTIDLQGSVL